MENVMSYGQREHINEELAAEKKKAEEEARKAVRFLPGSSPSRNVLLLVQSV